METRICTKCGKELPATNEYFGKAKLGKYGLKSQCKECHNALGREYKEKHREAEMIYGRKRRKENRENILKYQKEYRDKNKEKISAHKKEYNKNNTEKGRMYAQQRRARKRNLPNTLTDEQWNKVKLKFDNKCAYCGQELFLEQEHFIPISKGGDYTINNIIPSCRKCNRSKFNKSFFEWYPNQEFYSEKREKIILKYLRYEENAQQLKII